jgi:hypothetical protein
MKKLNLLFLSLFIIGLISTSSLFGQNIGDFRSVKDGNWTDINTWETYTTNSGGSWQPAATIPDSQSFAAVTIRSPHSVTVDALLRVLNLTVNSGATLNVSGSNFLYITYLGTMTVNGTLNVTGAGPASAPYTVTSSGTLTIGGTGVVNGNQTGSTPGIPSATWLPGSTLNVTSIVAATSFKTGGGQNFCNLNWNCPSQTANFGFSLYTNTISGTVSILNTGTKRVQFFASNNGTLTIMGDLIVSGSASASIQGTGSTSFDTLNLMGKVKVGTTGDFSVSKGSHALSGPGIGIWNFYGDSVSIIAGTMANSDTGGSVSKFVFKKQGNQYLTITPTTLSGNATPIEVDAGDTVHLTSKVNVTTLYLNGGMIVSSALNKLVIGWFNGTTLSSGNISPTASGSSTSFVNGPMAWLYKTKLGATSKTYPIGKGTSYRPLTLSFTQTDSTISSYTAEMFNSGIVSNPFPPTLNSVSSGRYYKIVQDSGSTFTAGEVKLSYDTDDGVTNASILRIAQGPDGIGTWVDLGGSGNTIPAGTITSSNTFTDLTTKTIFALAKASTRTLTLTAFLQGYTNTGGTAMVHAPSAVTVELHDATTPWGLVESQTGALSTAGVGTFTFSTAVNGTNYYIVVKTWNTVQTWSATAQSFTSGALSYDFTSAATQAYASNMMQIGTKWCFFSGDVNQDGFVNLGDYNIVNNNAYNQVNGVVVTDLNGDLFSNLSDVNIVNNNSYNHINARTPLLNPSAGMSKPPVMVNRPQMKNEK